MENQLFEKTSVPKAYITLALPVVLSMMVSLIYNMVDTFFIALTGNQDLVAGVSLVVPIFTMMIAFGDIFGLGGSSAMEITPGLLFTIAMSIFAPQIKFSRYWLISPVQVMKTFIVP